MSRKEAGLPAVIRLYENPASTVRTESDQAYSGIGHYPIATITPDEL
jgi:hypothetical protein